MDSISDLKRGVTKDITILMEEKSQFHFMVQAILFRTCSTENLTAEHAEGAERNCSAFSAISAVRKVISWLHKNDHNLSEHVHFSSKNIENNGRKTG